MKKYLLLCLWLPLWVGYSTAQTVDYEYIAGGRSADDGVATAVDASGNTYVAGVFSGLVDLDPTAAQRFLDAGGSQDVFLLKLDPAGNLLWVKAMGSESLDFVASIAVAQDGVWIFGEFGGQQFGVYPGDDVIDFTGSDQDPSSEDAFLIKLDVNGNVLAGKTFEASASDMALDRAGSVILTGTFRNTLTINNLGTLTWKSNGQQDAYVLKFNADLFLQWGKTFGGAQNEEVVALAVGPQDQIEVAGYFSGTVSFNPNRAGSGTRTARSNSSPDVFVQSLGKGGGYRGTKTYGSEGFDNVEDIIVDKASDVYLVGSFGRPTVFGPGAEGTLTPTTSGVNDGYLLKLQDGKFAWVKAYGTTGSDRLYALATDKAGGLYASGTYEGPLTLTVNGKRTKLTPEGPSDVFTLKIAPSGSTSAAGPTVLWANSLGNELDDYPRSLAVGSNGDVALTGVTRYRSNNEPENDDILIAKISQPATPNTLARGAAAETTYYVTTAGQDSNSRDGLSPATAWKTLAYATERVPAGNNAIKLGPGTFVETRTSVPKSGVSIVGNGSKGANPTIVQASSTWAVVGDPTDFDYANYIVGVNTFAMKPGSTELTTNLTIRNIKFRSSPQNLLDGAIFIRDAQDILIEGVHVEDFRWTGIRLAFVLGVEVRNSTLVNVNGEEIYGYSPGDIFTRWITDAEFHDITFINNVQGERVWGVGYKGGGHENTKIYNCSFLNDGSGFDIEIPFESEYGVEIFNCKFDSPISIPKGGQGDNPNIRGFDYSFYIHDNYMTNSYVVEGPRNHLRLSNNFIDIKNPGGRVYSQFGGNTDGPMWIDNNVVRNVDRAFIWKREGQLDSVYVYNNTVYMADAGERAASIIDSWGNMAGWEIKNNIFVAPDSQPRRLGSAADCSYCGEIDFTNNVLVNVFAGEDKTIPKGNYVDVDPGLFRSGKMPSPFYRPAKPTSFVVDKGVDVGFPFRGKAPDIGAYEYDASALPKDETVTVSVRARGTTGQEVIQLWVDNKPLANAPVLTTTYRDYQWEVPAASANIKVFFANDGRTTAGNDKNVRVNYLTINGEVRQAEAQRVNTGAYQNGSCGGQYSEWLYCQGYINFGTSTTAARQASAQLFKGSEPEGHAVTVFPNPVGSDGLSVHLGEDADVSTLTITDIRGATVYRATHQASERVQIAAKVFSNAGVYLLRIDNDVSTKTFRVLVE